ncbi:MAG: alpha/beta hydrolase [Deltaproteobacteria bacterium]|nr:alpha/beta hydrolase [Deltaproteobacteria bacterium]
MSTQTFTERVWRRLCGLGIDAFLNGAALAGRLSPRSWGVTHHVEVQRDLSYQATGKVEHRFDLYRPQRAQAPLPIVLYVHGGGFRILSKDTHYVMALAFARAGYLVLNINYRLAPRHRYPAALEDVAAAYAWTHANAAGLGGDPARLVVAGESAGANLALALAIACCYEHDEPVAREIFRQGRVPAAVWAGCGMLQVSNPGRFFPTAPRFFWERTEEIARTYLPAGDDLEQARDDLVDPLLYLERAGQPARPLPPVFASVGGNDPLQDDTLRLQRALAKLGGQVEARVYGREPHAFQAFVWRPEARRCWQDSFAFLQAVLTTTPR